MSASSTRGRGPRPRGSALSGSRGGRGGAGSLNIRGPPSSSSASVTPQTSLASASTGIIGHSDKSGRITAYTSPEDQCPQCKTDRFLNPKLKLLVSPCYHKLCTSCIDRIWALGPAPCPECGNVCRKSQFGSQTFQDLDVEREVDVRKRMQRVFTKTSRDFDSLKEYNDYLEEVEQLTFNLINGIDLAETNARVATHESRLSASSSKSTNANTASDTQSAIDAHLSSSKKTRLERYKNYALADRQLKNAEERAIVEALENGAEDEDIQRIQEEYTRKREEVERSRNAEEERVLITEEEERRVIANGPASDSKTNAQQQTTTIRWESLQLFSGPLATLSDGSELLPHLGDIRPPSPLHTALASRSSTATTYPLHDPWTSKTYTDQMDRDEKLKLNASGWDAAMPWAWECRVAVQSLGVRPGGGVGG